MTTLTFDREVATDILDGLGWTLTNRGYIRDDDDILVSVTGHPVHITEFAGVVEHEGERRILRDDFNELVEHVKYRHQKRQEDSK